MLHPIGKRTKSKRLDSSDSFWAGDAIGHHARKIRNLRKPSPVSLLFDLEV